MELKELTTYLDDATPEEKNLIEKAVKIAEEAHRGQTRESGMPYFEHLFKTAKFLASLKMSPSVIAAGLLHDSIEDGKLTSEELKKEFGNEIFSLVEGVTKLGSVKYRGIKRHVESLRKFFLATAKDPRILIIKLADRLHNMQTLEFLTEEKQKRVALETMEIYAPLAHRLGMGAIKGELEDLAFQYLEPEKYAQTKEILKTKSIETKERLEEILKSLKKLLAKEGVIHMRTDYRMKHTYSLYKKLLKHDMDIEKIYDISSLRVIVKDIPTCYLVLGIVHSKWRPLPKRIKDYIAFPKSNGYRSLHTTVFTGDGGIVEIQIRTEEMHNEAEYGLASHVNYKESGGTRKSKDEALEWLRQLAERQSEIKRPDEFLQSLQTDFLDQRLFVFTPKGDVIDLPLGSTPIDFAYAIHSDIGNHTFGAKINGKLVPLSTVLSPGDIIEIQTKKTSTPSRKWIEYAKTAFARKKIRGYLGLESSRRSR
jgi:GTP diphosphokinase / guanosine-3',5'-bis(diphosphate) 3'-diphosphatase